MKTKYAILAIALIIGLFGAESVYARDYEIPEQKQQVVDRVIVAKQHLLFLFQTKKLKKILSDKEIAAMILVESDNSRITVGDNGKALGPLQLWDVYVSDVNDTHKTYINNTDCIRDRELSILVMLAYMNRYAKGASLGKITRIHNGGPSGHLKGSTIKYHQKVLRECGQLKDWQVHKMIPKSIRSL